MEIVHANNDIFYTFLVGGDMFVFVSKSQWDTVAAVNYSFHQLHNVKHVLVLNV